MVAKSIPNGESTKAKKAVWDTHRKSVFIDLCLKQVRDGDKPGGYATKNGKSNMTVDFAEITGQNYSRAQFKNHLDALRKDWSAWNWLKKQKGVGWDSDKRTYTSDPEWWSKMAKGHPGLEKFRDGPLAYEAELDLFFTGAVAQGQDNITSGHRNIRVEASSDVASSHRRDSLRDNGVNCNSVDVGAFPSGSTKSYPPPLDHNARPKKARVGMLLNKNLLAILEEMREKKAIKKEYSYGRCVELMAETGCSEESEEWMFGLMAFRDKGMRQLFVHLRTPERRQTWLKAQTGGNV